MTKRTRRFLPAISLGVVLGVVGSFVPALVLEFSSVSILGRDAVELAAAETVAPPPGAPDTAPPGVDRAGRREGSANDVTPFTMIGVTVDHPSNAPVFIRTEQNGTWTDWYQMSFEDSDGPDRGSAEGRAAKVTTDGVWVGNATGYEINVAAGSGSVKALLVRDERRATVVAAPTATAGAETAVPPFPYNNRASWGAAPPRNAPGYSDQLRLGIVHHSDTNAGSAYSQGDVPGILRSIQAFHQQGRGWNDIAYNVVVDRFGTIWEGRAGGIDQPVLGSHALGFNTDSVGVMMIGAFQSDVPSNAAVDSVGKVLGWKMFLAGNDPLSTVQYTSGGSLSIPAGVVVTLPRIVAHRDVGATDCPGGNAYSRLGDIRAIAKSYYDWLVANFDPYGSVDAVSGGAGIVTVTGWVIDPDAPGATGEVSVALPDRSITVTATDSRPDVDAAFGKGPLHGFTAVMSGVPAGSHTVCVTFPNPGPGPDSAAGCTNVAVGPPVAGGSPVGAIASASAVPGGLSVSGFALDADQPAGISVNVSVGSQTRTVTATDARPGLGGTYAGQGDNHGFAASFGGLNGGNTTVCATAVNAAGGADVSLGCASVTLPGGSPLGIIDVVNLTGQTITAQGWLFDPDTPAPVRAVLQVDGAALVDTTADGDRPDIAAAFPGYGAAHGFTLVASSGLSPGDHSVCVYSDGVGQGAGRVVSCRTVTVPGAVGTPRGGMDPVGVGKRRATFTGWAIDSSTPARVLVWIVLDGQWKFAWAEQRRPFFGWFFPSYGDNHGFSLTVGLRRGNHRVCGASFTANLKKLVPLGCQTFRVR